MNKVVIDVPHYHPLCLDKNIADIAPFFVGLLLQFGGVSWYYAQNVYQLLKSSNYNFVFMLSLLFTTALLLLLFLSIALNIPTIFEYSNLLVVLAFVALCQSAFGILLTMELKKIKDKTKRTNSSYLFYLTVASGLILFIWTLIFVSKCYNNKEIP